MVKVKIRKARKEDRDGILGVIKKRSVLNPKDKSYKELNNYVDFCLSNKNFLVIIAEFESKIMGVCISHLYSLKETDADIYDLYVIKEFSRKGIGSSLMKFLCLELKKKGIKNLGLYSENNRKALNFYRKNGFQIGRLIRRCDKKIK